MRRVEDTFRQAPPRRPADLNRFEPFLIRYAAAYIEDQRPQSDSHGNLDQSGMGHVAHDRKNGRPGTPRSADLFKPIGTVLSDRRNAGQGCNVVDHRRLPFQTRLDWIRRTVLRHPAMPSNRLDQRGFLAAHKGPRALEHLDIQIEGAA